MTTLTLAHGNGGRLMRQLIEEVFAVALGDRLIECRHDATAVDSPPPGTRLVMTTDGFTVQPLEFPGGDIGALAVHGTVNDLAVSGAEPCYLTLNAFIEEGFELERLRAILDSLAAAAREAGVRIAAGDTKLVPRGHGGGLYLATAGIGHRPEHIDLDFAHIRDGDAVLVSGPVGDHGIAVMLAREEFGLRGDLMSDQACVLPLTRALLPLPGLRFMRDPTRGGVATVMHEIAHAAGVGIRLFEERIPVREPVRGVCEMLGYDPLFLACEGRVVAVLAPETVEEALARWQALPAGVGAMQIGVIEAGARGVVLQTELGGERVLQELENDPLPRIC